MGYTPPTLYVNKIAGGWSLTPPDNTTTDDLTIYANTADGYAKIKIEGAGNIYLSVPGGGYIRFSEETTGNLASIRHNGVDVEVTGEVANHNIALLPNGSGLVKFGAYTAGAATDSTGYITILDAAGNTRKLMVQA